MRNLKITKIRLKILDKFIKSDILTLRYVKKQNTFVGKRLSRDLAPEAESAGKIRPDEYRLLCADKFIKKLKVRVEPCGSV